MKRLKDAWGIALGVAFGTTIGGIIYPRVQMSYLYNETYPPIWLHALIGFVASYAAGLVVVMFIQYLKERRRKY